MIYQKFTPEGWNKDVGNPNENGIYQGIVKKYDTNNVYVEFGKEKGIIPKSEFDSIYLEKDGTPKINLIKSKVDNIVQFKILDKKDGEYILSRKEVQNEAINWIKSLKKGDIVDGIVSNIRPYGAFIEIGGGVVGLLHIEDISISRIKGPEERFKLGDRIQVKIKDINDNKIDLSYKELLGTWNDNIEDVQEKTYAEGIIRNIDSNKKGIFIELKPNLVGMAEYSDKYEYGQRVPIYIKKIDKEKQKIKLVIKEEKKED